VVSAQQEARDLFSSLECWLSSAPALTLPLHLVEQQQQIKDVFHPEGTPDAEIYARLMTHRILEGNVGQVVKSLRQTVTKRNLSGSKAKILLSMGW
jgi:hypothetical protein